MESKRKRPDEEPSLWPLKLQRFMDYLSSFFTKSPVQEEQMEPVPSTSELFMTPRTPESIISSPVTSVSHTRSSTSQYAASQSSYRTSPFKIRVLENTVFLYIIL
jgi:hypothetical protein